MSIAKRCLLNAVSIAMTVCLNSASAGETAYGVGYEGLYSDNVLYAPSNQQEEWTNLYYASIGYVERGSTIAAYLRARVEHLNYVNGLYADETLGYLSTAALWNVLPQRLIWMATDRLDQLRTSSIVPISPANRDAVNVFETGPDLLFPITPITTFVIGARYRNVWFKYGNDDSVSGIAAVRLRQRIGPTAVFSVNAEGGNVDFTEAPDPAPVTQQNYRRADYYFRYADRLAWARVQVDAGATRIVPEDTGEDVTEPIVRMNMVYRVGKDLSFGVAYGDELMSIGSAFLAEMGDPTVVETLLAPSVIPYELATGAVYRSKHGDLFLSITDPLLASQTSFFYRDIDYLATTDDRIEVGAYQRLQHNITPTLMIGAWGSTRKYEYVITSRLDRDVEYGVSFSYRLTPALTLGIEGAHIRRISSDVNSDYEENRGVIRLGYSSGPQNLLAGGRDSSRVP